MQCEYHWYTGTRRNRYKLKRVNCENEATEYTELPSAVKYDTKNVCKKCLKRIELQEEINTLVNSGVLNNPEEWEDIQDTS